MAIVQPPAPLWVSRAGAPPLAPNFINMLPDSTRRIRRAVTRARAPTRVKSTVLCVGDSTTRGQWSGGADVPRAWPGRLAARLTAAGIPASSESFLGFANFATTAEVTAADSRIAFGAGWTINSSQSSIGGRMALFAANTTPAPFTFTPQVACDQYDVYYLANVTLGPINVTRDGANPTEGAGITQTNNGQVARSTKTFASATLDPISIQAASGSQAQFFLIGVVGRNTADLGIEVINAGWGSSTSVMWAATNTVGQAPTFGIGVVNPDVLINGLGVNDWNPSVNTPLSTFSTNMAFITNAATNADKVLMFGVPTSTIFGSVAVQQSYGDVLRALSAANRWPLFDLQERWKDYVTANADGYMQDERHPNLVGNEDWGAGMSLMFRALG